MLSVSRTFVEIWAALDDKNRKLLRKEMLKLGVTSRTIDNWSKGMHPVNEITRKKACRIVCKFMGVSIKPDVLWNME